MGHGMLSLDKMVSGRKKSVWHQHLTGDKTKVVEGLLTAESAAGIGWARQDGCEGWWDPRRVAVYADAGDGNFLQVPDSFHIVRDDMPLNDKRRFISAGRGVGSGFELITNTDIIDLVAGLAAGGAQVDTCGSLNNGQRVYMTVLIGDADIKDDQVAAFLLVTTAHDGTAALEAIITPTRVVCMNTLRMARRDGVTRVNVQHRVNARGERLVEAARVLSRADSAFQEQITKLRALSDVRVTYQVAKEFIAKQFGEGKRAETSIDKIMDLFNGGQIGAEQDAVKGTWYGLVNAATQYIEQDMTLRLHEDSDGNKRDESEARLNSVLFGAGAKRREEIMMGALQLAGVS